MCLGALRSPSRIFRSRTKGTHLILHSGASHSPIKRSQVDSRDPAPPQRGEEARGKSFYRAYGVSKSKKEQISLMDIDPKKLSRPPPLPFGASAGLNGRPRLRSPSSPPLLFSTSYSPLLLRRLSLSGWVQTLGAHQGSSHANVAQWAHASEPGPALWCPHQSPTNREISLFEGRFSSRFHLCLLKLSHFHFVFVCLVSVITKHEDPFDSQNTSGLAKKGKTKKHRLHCERHTQYWTEHTPVNHHLLSPKSTTLILAFPLAWVWSRTSL